MAYNFIECDRETLYLMPPSLREWLPEDELAWFVLDAVKELDLSGFYGKYRADGWGRSAYDPTMMVALLLYAYSIGMRSSRQIERACRVDVAFRIIAANQNPDYSTICRFRAESEVELQKLFEQVLRLCAKAGLVKVGVIAIDGSKIRASASIHANRTQDGLKAEVKRIFEEAKAKDAEEDALYGPDKRGDELPEELRSREGRLKRLREAKARLEQEDAQAAAEQAEKVKRHEDYQKQTGKRIKGRPPKPVEAVQRKDAKANVTDPDSRIMCNAAGNLQGYNAQAAVTENQIIVAAEVTQAGSDHRRLNPMIQKAKEQLKAAGVKAKIGTALADAGYFSHINLRDADPAGPQLLIATGNEHRQRKELARQAPPRGRIPKGLSLTQLMQRKLLTMKGRTLYKLRSRTVEPVFGQIKGVRRFSDFVRRRLHAVESEWSLYCSTHNLLKLWRSGKAKFSSKIRPTALAWA